MKGIIDKIVCNETEEVYYGSTHTSLSSQSSELHRASCVIINYKRH